MKCGLRGHPVSLSDGASAPCEASAGPAILPGSRCDVGLTRLDVVAIRKGMHWAGRCARLFAAIAGFGQGGGCRWSRAPQCTSKGDKQARFGMNQKPNRRGPVLLAIHCPCKKWRKRWPAEGEDRLGLVRSRDLRQYPFGPAIHRIRPIVTIFGAATKDLPKTRLVRTDQRDRIHPIGTIAKPLQPKGIERFIQIISYHPKHHKCQIQNRNGFGVWFYV